MAYIFHVCQAVHAHAAQISLIIPLWFVPNWNHTIGPERLCVSAHDLEAHDNVGLCGKKVHNELVIATQAWHI